VLRLLRRWLSAFVSPIPLLGLVYLPRFVWHWLMYSGQAGDNRPRIQDSYPCLTDWTPYTSFDPHYFFQGAWLARRLQFHPPQLHVDIASSVLTVSTISAQFDTVFVDYRPVRPSLSGMAPVAGNIVCLPFATGSLSSLSCLHVIEHIGLGRYGDLIDPEGSMKGARELMRVLGPGGLLYLSTPVGRERVEFNAHRVFAPHSVMGMFSGLELVEFSYVDDGGTFRECRDPQEARNSEYACGLYLFRKPPAATD
jgi:SAM-dependent methyltransferase